MPTLLLIIRNGKRYGDSVREIAATRGVSYEVAKDVYFAHRKKIEKTFFAQ